ncbi:MAG: DUF4426 domain-containing protein [Proteobacteria bacterium]|nr:DUF4426 domain-containing protein [Pseudomonadota bacterium]
MKYILLIATLIISPSLAKAEQKTTQGDYEVHYSTFPSLSLSKEIANNYQIKRSKSRIIISLTVLNTASEPHTPTKANIKIVAKNLFGQIKPIKLRKIVEQDKAIYYLGYFSISNKENVNFTINIVPQGERKNINLKFSREFFND